MRSPHDAGSKGTLGCRRRLGVCVYRWEPPRAEVRSGRKTLDTDCHEFLGEAIPQETQKPAINRKHV